MPLYHDRDLFITFCCFVIVPVTRLNKLFQRWYTWESAVFSLNMTEGSLRCAGVNCCLISERPEGGWSAGHSGLFSPRELRVPIETCFDWTPLLRKLEREEFQCWYRESNARRWVGSRSNGYIMTVWSLVGCSCRMVGNWWIWRLCVCVGLVAVLDISDCNLLGTYHLDDVPLRIYYN
jgi:hypothetical protein